MNDSRPFMLLRARAKPEVREAFDAWFDRVHLKDVERIPGISGILKGRDRLGTRLAVYSFESTEMVQTSLGSPEAAYARGTWERWQPELEELLIELWAAAQPMAIYQGAN